MGEDKQYESEMEALTDWNNSRGIAALSYDDGRLRREPCDHIGRDRGDDSRDDSGGQPRSDNA
ncbi:MAG: hypothetical protein WAY93_01575 [Atopobiaceae bacterium]|jgi:hypothetical protein|nr:hypothetical protein [Atopobiaceae bacterium]